MQVSREREAKRTPQAEALGARLLETLRTHLIGNCVSLCGDRSPDHFAKALRGEDGKVISVARDIAQLASRPEREARAAIHDFAAVLLDAVRPTDGTLIGEAVATFLREATEVAATYARALDDGTLDLDECGRVQQELADVSRELARLGAALEGHRRRLAS